jgi:putative nucleotidyltransferase with HDIG domain
VAAGVAVPLFGLRQLYKTNYQLETINQELLQLLVNTVEARDPYTSGHSSRVSRYAEVICKILALPGRESQQVVKAALLHDVGKIHEEFHPILRKPGKLSAEEYEIMQTHAAKGAVLVATVTQFKVLAPSIRGHHEAWDGHGYPDRLSGDNIPLAARIIAIADTIDAMSTDRPYREALEAESIRRELILQKGKQFDPTLIARITDSAKWMLLAHEMKVFSKATGRMDATAGDVSAVPSLGDYSVSTRGA